MFALTNDFLTVEVLDPVADQHRMGARYCTGGYIFQVRDHALGNLLSGPTFPAAFNTFDGQGIPDAFNLSPLRSTSASTQALVLGVGLCDLGLPFAQQVLRYCEWHVVQAGNRISMRTVHTFEAWQLELTRTVTLSERSVRAEAHIQNGAQHAPIPLRWFPHPFYPQTNTDELMRLNIDVDLAENESYVLQPNGFIARRFWPWVDGRHYLPLNHASRERLVVQQRHPSLGLVSATCSYVPNFFPIWGNPNTFSWEPFLERTVAAGQSLHWWIDYDF